jgi:acyl carrier protein
MNRKETIMNYIKNELMRNPNAKINDNDDLLSAGILDSLGILQLVAYIEKTFGIQVPDEDVVFENFQSMSALDNYLSRY